MGYKTYTCPIAKQCGGCEWLAVPYPLQLKRKQNAMQELFSDVIEPLPIIGMDEPKAYRHKAATPFAPAAKGRIRSGFYQKGTHRIVHAKECLVEASPARQILDDVAYFASKLKISAYHEDSQKGILRHAVVRIGKNSGQIMLILVTNGQSLPHKDELIKKLTERYPRITTVVQNINQKRTNAILGTKNQTLMGAGYITDTLLGCSFEIRPTSFYQTNPEQTEKLYQLAIDLLKEKLPKDKEQLVLDAYCGTGSIGLCMAKQLPYIQLIGVDSVYSAIVCAKRNAKLNKLEKRSQFITEDATSWLQKSVRESALKLDAIVLDPPRAGSTPQFISAAAATGAKYVVYISCNPQTQKRDFEEFKKHGYKIENLTPVDLFPHTKHVETIAILSH